MIQIQLIGRLTRNPDTRVTPSGDDVANFSLACNGYKKDKTTYFECAVWGKRASVIDQYCQKGTQLYIQGNLSTRTYQKRDGGDGFSLVVNVSDFHFVGSKKDGESQPDQTQESKPSAKERTSKAEELPEINVDEMSIQMPF